MVTAPLKYPLRVIVLLLGSLLSRPVIADVSHWQQAQWDLGIGLAGFDYPLYPGSRDSDQLFLPSPYFTYISPVLEIDRGIKGMFYRSDRLVLDISADFALPVDSSDSRARAGMNDLDAVLQLGPSLELLLTPPTSAYDTRLELPLRLALATDITSNNHLGWLLEPRVSIEHRRSGRRGMSWKLTTGLIFAGTEYHDYYYAVQAADATPQRPVYDAAAGRGGWFVSWRGSMRLQDWVWWWYARYHTLKGSEIEQSPLVETTDYVFVGAGFSWIFASNL